MSTAGGGAGDVRSVTPRATEKASVQKWLPAGRVAAIVSGACSLSSNRSGGTGAVTFGGCGWVIDPAVAEQAKKTYLRYVAE
jgi:hypothetical protein